MIPSTLLLPALLAPLAAASCPTAGVHMMVARGSSEAPGEGSLSVIAGNITRKLPGSTAASVDYPATFESYIESEAKGVAALSGMLTKHVAACPDSRVVLLGYSQGAQVAMDVICGTTETDFDGTPDLTPKFRDNIIAVVAFGDPSHVTGVPWDVGTSKHKGIFERHNTSACAPYSDAIRSWCDDGDFYCDSGTRPKVHGAYFAKYTDDAVDFVVSRFNASSHNGSGTGTGSPSATTSAPSSTSTTADSGNGAAPFGSSGVFAVALVALVAATWVS